MLEQGMILEVTDIGGTKELAVVTKVLENSHCINVVVLFEDGNASTYSGLVEKKEEVCENILTELRATVMKKSNSLFDAVTTLFSTSANVLKEV